MQMVALRIFCNRTEGLHNSYSMYDIILKHLRDALRGTCASLITLCF